MRLMLADVQVWLLACMLLVFLSLVEYAIILRKIVIHQRNLEKWRQEQIKEKKQDQSSEVGSNVSNVLKIFYCCYIAAAILGVVIAQRRWKWRDQHKGKTTPNWNKASSQNCFLSLKWRDQTNSNLLRFRCRTELKFANIFVRLRKWPTAVRSIPANGKPKFERIVVTSLQR